MLKRMLKKVCARTQPCFTPLTMGKGSDGSPLSLIWPRWSSCIGSPCWGIFQDSRDAQEATTDLTCWQCRRLLLGRQMLHTDPCFVHGISPGVDGERKPCPLCLCWLWSHNDSLEDVLRRWMAQACWAVSWQGLYGRRPKGWSPDSWKSQIVLPSSCTGWWWLRLEDLVVACPVPSSRRGVHGACGVV